MTDRNVIFGRLIAIATVLGDRVFEKGTTSISGEFLDKIGKQPALIIERIHQKLMNYAYKFGPEEMILLDMFGEQINQLETSDFDNLPLDHEYLLHYYKQKQEYVALAGVAEVAEILNIDKRNIGYYTSKPDFPKEAQRLASGPLWVASEVQVWKDSH